MFLVLVIILFAKINIIVCISKRFNNLNIATQRIRHLVYKQRLPKHCASGADFLMFNVSCLMYYMHEVTPSAVAIADRILIVV